MATGFPALIRSLPRFDGPFDAHRLRAAGCDVLFASYPAGTVIAPHRHETRNVGVVTSGELRLGTASGDRVYGPGEWYQLEAGEEHWAHFERDTSEIEFWFEPHAAERR